jgi:hypothetical protein
VLHGDTHEDWDNAIEEFEENAADAFEDALTTWKAQYCDQYARSLTTESLAAA